MATKKKNTGKKPTTPIPASVWFEKQSSLPTDVLNKGPKEKAKKALSAINKLGEAIPAAIWFDEYDKLPKDTSDLVVTKVKDKEPAEVHVTVHPATSTIIPKDIPSISKDESINGLVDPILSLTKEIHEERIQRIRGDEIDRSESKGPNSFKGLIKAIMSDKMAETKSKLSIRNLMLTAGVRSAFKGSDTIVDRLLSYREQAKDKTAEATKKPSVFGSIAMGTADYLGKKASKTFAPITDSKPVKALGSMVDVLTAPRKLPKITIPSPFAKLAMKSKIEAIRNPDTLWGSIARRQYPEISKDPELETSRILTNPSSAKERAFTSEVRSGMKDELVTLNEEQLTQLKKLVSAMTVDKEDRLEAMDKAPADISQKKEAIVTKDTDQDSNKSLLNTILGGFSKMSGIVSSALSTLGPILGAAGSLMRFAAPIAGQAALVAGAGAAGYMAGGWLNDNVINPGMEKLTGVKGATLGTAVYDAVDGVAGWFGASDADKIAEQDAARLKALGKTQTSSGKITGMEPQAYREKQTAAIKTKVADISSAKQQASNNTNIVDNRSTVTNQSTTVQYVRPHVKNTDSTFNNLLGRNFSH